MHVHMSYTEIVYFSVTLLFALVALSLWKRRRDDKVAGRLKRGLHSYVSGNHDLPAADIIVCAAPAPVKIC